MPKQESPTPRMTALLALAALDRYCRDGLVQGSFRHPETLHETLAVRLARVARSNKWE